MRPWLALLLLSACSSPYSVTFICEGGDACPEGQPCPTVPLGGGGCEALPNVHGNSTIPVDAGRPVGCRVGLAEGNGAYGGEQIFCFCTQTQWPDAGPDAGVPMVSPPHWACPL